MKKNIQLLLEGYLIASIIMCFIALLIVPHATWLMWFCFAILWVYEIEVKLQKINDKPKGWLLIYEVAKSVLWNIKEGLRETFFFIIVCIIIGFEFIGFTITQTYKDIKNNPNAPFFGIILLMFSILIVGPLGIWWLYYQAPHWSYWLIGIILILIVSQFTNWDRCSFVLISGIIYGFAIIYFIIIMIENIIIKPTKIWFQNVQIPWLDRSLTSDWGMVKLMGGILLLLFVIWGIFVFIVLKYTQ